MSWQGSCGVHGNGVCELVHCGEWSSRLLMKSETGINNLVKSLPGGSTFASWTTAPQVPTSPNGSTYCETCVQTHVPVLDTPHPNYKGHKERRVVFIQTLHKTNMSNKDLNLTWHFCVRGHFWSLSSRDNKETRFSKDVWFWPMPGWGQESTSARKSQNNFFLKI